MTVFPLHAIQRQLAGMAEYGAHVEVEPMADTGLAHWHARIIGHDLVVRAPKQSQMGLGADENLTYQAACFRACTASRATPKLKGILPPRDDLPLGALIVEEIIGRPPVLAADLPAIARALAAIHTCPQNDAVRSLFCPERPLRMMVDEITEQAIHLSDTALEPAALSAVNTELKRALADIDKVKSPVTTLISFDAHPGNFLIRNDGSAVLVDLEKARISLPGFDLAHATLYTSTTWDPAVYAVLAPGETAAFYCAWEEALGTDAKHHRPYHALTRRLMWLWSVTWCAKWRATSGLIQKSAEGLKNNAEDWSAEHSESALIEHVKSRVDDYLCAVTIDSIRDDIAAFD